VELPALTPAELSARVAEEGEPSASIACRVAAARERQQTRQAKTNRELSGREVDEVCRPDASGELLLREASERFGWSARVFSRWRDRSPILPARRCRMRHTSRKRFSTAGVSTSMTRARNLSIVRPSTAACVKQQSPFSKSSGTRLLPLFAASAPPSASKPP
jgi:hypothetical protein